MYAAVNESGGHTPSLGEGGFEMMRGESCCGDAARTVLSLEATLLSRGGVGVPFTIFLISRSLIAASPTMLLLSSIPDEPPTPNGTVA